MEAILVLSIGISVAMIWAVVSSAKDYSKTGGLVSSDLNRRPDRSYDIAIETMLVALEFATDGVLHARVERKNKQYIGKIYIRRRGNKLAYATTELYAATAAHETYSDALNELFRLAVTTVMRSAEHKAMEITASGGQTKPRKGTARAV